MDTTGPLQSIAQSLPSLPLEAIDSMLVTFDMLTGLGGEEGRSNAAKLLRDAAALCHDPNCRDRLLRAAQATAAGQPSALTPDGLNWKQAAAANTVTMEEWEARGGDAALPEPPAESVSQDEDDDESEEEATVLMEEEPPELPWLHVRHFFPGLVVRVGREIADDHGRALSAGLALRLLASVCDDDEAVMSFPDRTVRLDSRTPAHRPIMENAGNQWFQPVPSIDCLEDLWELVEGRLNEVDLDDDDPATEMLEDVICDVGECEDWLFADDGSRGPAPQCASAPLAAEVFGRDREMTAWIRLLFAGVRSWNPER